MNLGLSSSLRLLLLLLASVQSSRKVLNEAADERDGKLNQLLRLDLVVMVLVDRAEHSINVLVGDRDADVVFAEEIHEELAELTPIEERIAVGIVRAEVLLDLFSELSVVSLESLKLFDGGLELAFLEVCRVDHVIVSLL